MEKVRILHCGDMHFDTPFTELKDNIAEIRREELRETFGEIIRMAREEKVDFLLMPGDIFDNSSIMKQTLDYMIKKFLEIPEIMVFIAPGNHDPISERSFYRMIEWPANVHIFGGEMESVEILHKKVCIHGRGFDKSHVRESLFGGFKAGREDLINIMVLHGDVVRGSGTSDYNPVGEEEIAKSRMDYIALGHLHSFSGILRSGKTFWAYSGCPEGRGFDEGGDKGVVVGDISRGHVDLSFRKICRRRYFEKKVDISGVGNHEEIELKIYESLGLHDARKNIEDAFNDVSRDLYKIILTGELEQDFSPSTVVMENKMNKHFFSVKIVDNTTVKVDYEKLEKEFSLKGLFVKKMMERIREANDEKTRESILDAVKLGLAALDNREVTLDED